MSLIYPGRADIGCPTLYFFGSLLALEYGLEQTAPTIGMGDV